MGTENRESCSKRDSAERKGYKNYRFHFVMKCN